MVHDGLFRIRACTEIQIRTTYTKHFKPVCFIRSRAGEGISEPLSDILYNMLSDELFKHPATQIESMILSCR